MKPVNDEDKALPESRFRRKVKDEVVKQIFGEGPDEEARDEQVRRSSSAESCRTAKLR